MKLKNLIMFTGNHCAGCHAMKQMFEREDITIKIISVDSQGGALEAMKWNVRSLPTFVNTESMKIWNGTSTRDKLIELNEV